MPQPTSNHPLSDLSRIKEDLGLLFFETPQILRLVMPAADEGQSSPKEDWYGGHFFDLPYQEGLITDSRCAIFVDTRLSAVPNPFLKEVALEISVVCHKDNRTLPEEDASYYRLAGIYGNRVDCLCQAIHTCLMSAGPVRSLMKEYSIGSIHFSKEDPLALIAGTSVFGKTMTYTYQSGLPAKCSPGL